MREYTSGMLSTLLVNIGPFSRKYYKIILMLFLALLVFSIVGITKIRVETHVSSNFKESSEVIKAINFVQIFFSGMDVVVLVADTKEEYGLHDPQKLWEIEKLW